MFKRKHLYFSIVLLALSVVIVYNYMYKEHRDIQTEKADFKFQTKLFANEFSEDIIKASALYLDKTIQLTGIVTEIESDNFTLDDVVVCYTDSITIKKISLKNTFLVKGRSIGYDELLGLIKLDQVTIMN